MKDELKSSHLKHEANVKVNHALYWPAGGDSFSLKKGLAQKKSWEI